MRRRFWGKGHASERARRPGECAVGAGCWAKPSRVGMTRDKIVLRRRGRGYEMTILSHAIGRKGQERRKKGRLQNMA
ncbi:hypothetical protein EDC27_1622 [Desulfosoma caldarium]|uniref:Uncharacterized protein n=1 Tax=Desulfosoma caldarium TaxID=610254 RepID=A0A3N1V0D1_9BACT|nr:hypothetical protein EDC27_1622 [Desulfosoma caldarium]